MNVQLNEATVGRRIGVSIRPIPPGLKFVPELKIIETVTKHFNISFDEINVRSRKREVKWPRQVIMYLMSRYTAQSYDFIGRLFTGLDFDHTTVIHSKNTVQGYVDVYDEVRCEIMEITNKLYE